MKTILVVDDEPAIRAVVRDALHDEGYAVLEAPHGRALLALLERERPDLVLMDVMMPGGDGREAFRAMRTLANGNGLPVIMMSGGVKPHDLDPEITAFLRKPVDLEDLLALVARLLRDG